MEEKTKLHGTTSIKVILDDIKGVIGLKSITFLLDNQPLKSIPPGGSAVFEASPGQHKIQTVLKARSIATFFITVTRKSTILTLTVAPDSQVSVIAKYNRTWGNIEIKQSDVQPPITSTSKKYILPQIPNSYFDYLSCRFTPKIINQDGDKFDKESVKHFNEGKYDDCLISMSKALELGIGEHEQAYTYQTMGKIYIIKKELPKAVESFLKSLSISNRPDEVTFGSSVRLSVIYNAVGRKEASLLLQLAENSNTKGWIFSKATELSNLAKEQVNE